VQITNKFNLPEIILNFAKSKNYDSGKSDITVTQLIDSPRIVNLRKTHAHELSQDISEMLWMFMGTAVHQVFEKGAAANTVTEERLFVKINGWNISGAIDTQVVEPDGVIIGDYKFTSVWAVMNDKPDWEYQLNLYAWLVEKVKGLKVKSLQIHALCRDWNRRDSVKEGYPQAPLVSVDIPLWSMEKREAFVIDRLAQHADADTTRSLGGELPLCTNEDQWRRKETYAVMKTGLKRASRVFDNKPEADSFAAANKDMSVVLRPAEPTRCKNNFCRVADFCEQYKSEAV
jgi:hypothetical protein